MKGVYAATNYGLESPSGIVEGLPGAGWVKVTRK